MKATLTQIALVMALALGLLAAWIYDEISIAESIAPPGDPPNLVAFLEARPNPTRIVRFPRNDIVYFKVTGKYPKLLFGVPSGPPVYVFDESGAIVGWCRDSGDGNRFMEIWWEPDTAVPITVEEAKRMVSAQQPAETAGASPERQEL